MLLDDELHSLTYLKLLCEQIPNVEVVKAFNNPTDFLKQQVGIEYDIVIMDIEMPEITGIQLADFVKDKGIIFTTAYSEYAADAFDLQAIDYIRKPLKLDRLKLAINKAIHKVQIPVKRTFIQLNSDIGKFVLHFDQIRYIRTATDSRDKIVSLANGNEVTLKNISFRNLETLLPLSSFCRINKKELIALNIVRAFSYDKITSTIQEENNSFKTFILSDRYKSSFIEKINL